MVLLEHSEYKYWYCLSTLRQGCATIDCIITIYCNIYCHRYIVLVSRTITRYCIVESNNINICCIVNSDNSLHICRILLLHVGERNSEQNVFMHNICIRGQRPPIRPVQLYVSSCCWNPHVTPCPAPHLAYKLHDNIVQPNLDNVVGVLEKKGILSWVLENILYGTGGSRKLRQCTASVESTRSELLIGEVKNHLVELRRTANLSKRRIKALDFGVNTNHCATFFEWNCRFSVHVCQSNICCLRLRRGFDLDGEFVDKLTTNAMFVESSRCLCNKGFYIVEVLASRD